MSTAQLTIESLKRPHFNPEEFFVSETAERLGLKNQPSPANSASVLPCLMSTADLMEEIRVLLGKSIRINSAYRRLEVNRAVGSKDNSQHLQGLACDFVCPDFGTPEEIVKFLHDKKVLVDQCFNEGSWVHVSRTLNADKNRKMYGFYLPDADGQRHFKAL